MSTPPPRAQDLTSQRDAFFLPEGVHYLNCAYMGPAPRVSEAAGIRGMSLKRVPTRLSPPDFFEDSDRLRSAFARLVNASDPDRIAILPSASYGIAVAARNTPVSRGQNIVVLYEQFPGNLYSWRRVAAERGAELRTVQPPDGVDKGRIWNVRILEAIDAGTAVVTLPHVHWTDGTRFDLGAIGARAREVGAALIVDGTQSVGALPFDVQELRPDALIVAGYKWLLGPYSLGVGYFGPRYDDGVPLEETWIGRERSEDFQHLVDYEDAYRPAAVRYDVGERCNFILVPMLLESVRLLNEWGPARVQEYCRTLTGELLEEVQRLGFSLEDEAFRSSHLFGLRMPAGLDLGRVRGELTSRQVWASLRGSALRLSPNVYNDGRDMAALLDALKAAL